MELREYYSKKAAEVKSLISETEEKPYMIAIDGRCTAGKTTFASFLAEELNASVVHMDDFFLRMHQRTAERYSEPGGNVDRERVREVLRELRQKKDASFRMFDCTVMELGDEKVIPYRDVIIVEGSYSQHPYLQDFYNLKIFLDVDPEVQQKRILQRNGEEKLRVFNAKWIPYEEKYFSAFHIGENSDYYLNTAEEAD